MKHQKRTSGANVAVVAVSLVFAIPLIAIASASGGLLGILAVCGVILLVNMLAFLRR
jgi:hypothetical protein